MSDKELLERLLLRIDLLCHDKQYRFRNDDGTWYSREACRDLTNEELIKELDYEFNNLNETLDDFENVINSEPTTKSKITRDKFVLRGKKNNAQI